MQSKSLAWSLALAGFIFGVIGCAVTFWIEWRLYRVLSALPAGTEVRPMGEAAEQVIVGFFTFLLAIPFSVAGISFGLKQHRAPVWILSAVGIVLGVSPLPFGIWLGRTIFAVKGIVFEP